MAEELALVAMNPRKRSPGLGMHQHLNACLAGLLLGDLVMREAAALGPKDTIVLAPGASFFAGTLAGAAQVVAEKGPAIKAILSGMDRGLRKHLGRGTWDAVLAGLSEGVAGREKAIERLRAAAASDEPIVKKLDENAAKNSGIEKLPLDEKTFRFLVNEDAMATEKTAEGIRLFNADAVKLQDYLAAKL